MKRLPLIVFCYFVTMVCCTNKHADNVVSPGETVVADSVEEVSTDMSMVKSSDEDFIAFIKRFHGDTVFQSERIAEVVDGFCSDKNKNGIWILTTVDSYSL